ncbi:hypothetical protein [Streptomyces sp. NPDC047000]|uniref:hypothetical protein n=1 Tax=Streptomyces sp. NPDC047000 TaxID=3155474 RepID=UPI00340282AE
MLAIRTPPGDAVFGIRPSPPPGIDVRTAVATLGPRGTDSVHEARKYFSEVVTLPTVPEVMDYAEQESVLALVPAGHLTVSDNILRDSWVNLHFRFQGRMSMVGLWESPTKKMCAAVNVDRAGAASEVRSVALHPATAAFAQKIFPADVELRFCDSKPIAVRLAEEGRVDACIGSLDVVQRAAGLRPVEEFEPTMIWCLYSGLGHIRNPDADS